MVPALAALSSASPRHEAGLFGTAFFAVAAKLAAGTALGTGLDAAFFGFAILAFFAPWFGALALLPLLFALPPTPAAVGLREAGYATLCASVILATLWREHEAGRLWEHVRRLAWTMAAVAALFAINLVVATGHGVPLADWARSAIPFAFLGLFLPFGILLARDLERLDDLVLALLLTGLLFTGQVLAVYFHEGLYEAAYYVMQGDDPVRVDPDLHDPAEVIGPFFQRVTILVQQSTDSFLPISFVAGFVLFVIGPDRRTRLLFAVLAYMAALAILATYTRSMVLAVVGVAGLFGLWLLAFDRRLFLPALGKGLLLVILSIAGLFATNMDLVWQNRLLTLYYSLGLDRFAGSLARNFGYGVPTETVERMRAMFGGDANVLSRIEEYRLALERFLADPITGAGLGLKHTMRFETAYGDPVIVDVAYIHNWVLYMMMVGGVLGLVAFAAAFAGPVLRFEGGWRAVGPRLRPGERDRLGIARQLLWTGALTLAVYGLFFAVFKLISFNLLLGLALGLAYAMTTIRRERAA